MRVLQGEGRVKKAGRGAGRRGGEGKPREAGQTERSEGGRRGEEGRRAEKGDTVGGGEKERCGGQDSRIVRVVFSKGFSGGTGCTEVSREWGGPRPREEGGMGASPILG